MSVLLALIIGGAVGTAFGFLWKESFNLLAIDVIFGVAGSVIGLVLYIGLFGTAAALGLFDPLAALSMLVGALLFTLGFNAINELFPKQITKEGEDEEREPDK
jgi:uncharacterized membrane protein